MQHSIDEAQARILQDECVVCEYIRSGSQSDHRQFLTVCYDHADKKHPQVRAFFNRRAA